MPAYTLGDLEKEIMEILWAWPVKKNEKVTVKGYTVQQIATKIQQKRPLAYTTVATVLTRLHEKKIVTKHADKNYYCYSPAVSRDEFSTSVVHHFMQDFIHSFGDMAIPSFAGGLNKLSAKDKQKLITLLETNEKK